MHEQKTSNTKNHLLSWLAFLPTLIIVLFTLILGMFPALLIAFSDKVRFPVEINALEPSSWMVPILISNTIIFATIILYQKNKLPSFLTSLFKFISNFEVSKRIALVLLVILIGTYAILTVGELYTEEPWEDYFQNSNSVKVILENWSFDSDIVVGNLLMYFFGYLSLEIFGSPRIFPFIASIVCLFLTYLITVQISKKRFAGIIALGLVLQSGNFLTYDTTITYPIFWIMFLLLSIYFIFKSWPLSAIFFIPAALSKMLSISFVPFTILFIAMLDLPKRKKLLLLSSYFVLCIIGLLLFFIWEGVSITGLFPFLHYSSFDVTKIMLNPLIILVTSNDE